MIGWAIPVLKALGSPLGRAAALLAAFLAWTAYQRQDAASDALAGFRERVEQETRAEQARQLEAARRVAEQARERADESDARAERVEAQRDEVIRSLEGADCPIPDDVRDGLLEIGN